MSRRRRRPSGERQEAQQRRIAELEAEVEATATRAEQLGRHFHEAVEGWGAERRRSEGASFPGDGERTYIRNHGHILGIR